VEGTLSGAYSHKLGVKSYIKLREPRIKTAGAENDVGARNRATS